METTQTVHALLNLLHSGLKFCPSNNSGAASICVTKARWDKHIKNPWSTQINTELCWDLGAADPSLLPASFWTGRLHLRTKPLASDGTTLHHHQGLDSGSSWSAQSTADGQKDNQPCCRDATEVLWCFCSHICARLIAATSHMGCDRH